MSKNTYVSAGVSTLSADIGALDIGLRQDVSGKESHRSSASALDSSFRACDRAKLSSACHSLGTIWPPWCQ
jgi:hypothetical protein